MVYQTWKTYKKAFFVNKNCNEENEKDKLELSLINIQGLTQQKQLEIEGQITPNTIMCLTETQHKYIKVNISNNITEIHSHRDKSDRKGGGLSIMMTKNVNNTIEKVDNIHSDILHAKLKIQQLNFTIILVYMSANDNNRNNIIQKKINTILRTAENEPITLLGDFNGHVGFLGPQETNTNGRRVLQWITEHNLICITECRSSL